MQTHNSRQRDERLQSQDRLNGRLNDQEVHHGRGRDPWQPGRQMSTPDRGGIAERRYDDDTGQRWGHEPYLGSGSSRGHGQKDIDDMPDSRPYGRERYGERSFNQSERFTGPAMDRSGWDRGIDSRNFNDRGYMANDRNFNRNYVDRSYIDRSYGDRGYMANDRNFNDRGYMANDRNFNDRGYMANDRNFNDRGTWGSPNQEFLGRGPKGYMRSDERIREEVCEILSQGYLDASDIEVEVKNGEVILTGTVVDRRTKRLAEEIVESARGVQDVDVRLKIKGSGAGIDTERNIDDTTPTNTVKKNDHVTSTARETVGATSRRPNASA